MPRKQNKKNSRRAMSTVSRFDDAPSYSGQARFRVTLPAAPLLLRTTVTTGQIASSAEIKAEAVTGFADRFGSTFDEYRIVKCKVLIRPVSASTGVSVMMFDEKNIGPPTSTESQERVGKRLANTNANSRSFCEMTWVARDLLDLNYSPIDSTDVIPVAFKTYTDATLWGAPVVATDLWIIEPEITFEFKGLKST
jgi:hypothetical protein